MYIQTYIKSTITSNIVGVYHKNVYKPIKDKKNMNKWAELVVGLLFVILLSFPLVLLSAGLFLIVINAFILYLTVYVIEVMDIDGVSMAIQGLLTYLLAAVILGLANSTIHWFLKE
jgi:hypothetical protein